MQAHRPNRAPLGALILALAASAPPATAQTLQVLELNYAPTTSGPIDLRPGPYLLELRGPASGPFVGILRGPNNETVATDLSVAATGCTTGLPTSPRMTVVAQPGRLHINAITIAISGGGTCQLSTTAANLSLVSSTGNPPPQFVTCNGDPENAEKARAANATALGKSASSGDRIACSEVDPSVTLAPDLTPVPPFALGGQFAPWGGVIQVSASQAASRSDGRCYYPYTYDIRNIGTGPSGGTLSILTVGDPLGLNIQTRTVPALLPASQVPINGLIGLPPGRWELNVYVDPNNAVLEFNGGNNVGTVRVEVSGRCTTP